MAKRTILNKIITDQIIDLYSKKKENLANIGRIFSINPKVVKRILKENNIQTTGIKGRFYRIVTEEHRKNISKSLKGKQSPIKGIKKDLETILKGMEGAYRLEYGSLREFKDLEKLKFITKWIVNLKASDRDQESIINFIKRFYYCNKFNTIYQKWISCDKNKLILPTLDHIIPISRGGSKTDINNLQILTWFENRTKNNMTQDEWENFKILSNTKSDFFI
jgi:5-methylcytosine-specific restriction endonuclease McrA